MFLNLFKYECILKLENQKWGQQTYSKKEGEKVNELRLRR